MRDNFSIPEAQTEDAELASRTQPPNEVYPEVYARARGKSAVRGTVFCSPYG
jgi:hypothetical protein